MMTQYSRVKKIFYFDIWGKKFSRAMNTNIGSEIYLEREEYQKMTLKFTHKILQQTKLKEIV